LRLSDSAGSLGRWHAVCATGSLQGTALDVILIVDEESYVTEIARGRDLVTLINVFTVAPEKQQRLVDLLIEATDAVMKELPGFISANIHRSLDGTRVVNYAQWRRREDFEAMLQNPVARPHLQESASIATFEPNLYEVVHVENIGNDSELR
jgi:quinol monooxygenase YgiN